MSSNLNNPIYIDVGNTLVKIAAFQKAKNQFSEVLTVPTGSIPTHSDFLKRISDFFGPAKARKCFVSCVEPVWRQFLTTLTQNSNDIEMHFIQKTNLNLPIFVSPIANFAEFADDVLVLSAYAASQYKNHIIVSAGTGTVIFPIVQGIIQGYVIAPGMGLSRHAVQSKATLLKGYELMRTTQLCSLKTAEALSIGSVNVYWKGIMQHIHDLQQQFYASAVPIIATGHDARWMENFAPQTVSVDFLFLLKALRFWFEELA